MNSPSGSCLALIPAKPLLHAKSRLSAVLDPPSRERLVEAMLRHVIETALAAQTIETVVMLGRQSPAYPSLDVIEDGGHGLNAALSEALAQVATRGVDRMIVIAGDLPLLETEELDRMGRLPSNTIGIAPDRHGTGTNALSLPLPGAREFRFAYGSDSFALHRAEAERIGHNAGVMIGDGLAKDVDDPADLADAN